jgi:hypothetical protein
VEINTEMEAVYRAMQRARTAAARAAATLATTAPTPLFNRGELYMLLAYSELMLGEGWCSGVPFSSEDGTTISFGQPLTTEQMFQQAVAHFDTALSLAETNARVLNGSKIGKGRTLMNLGKFAEAAAAVTGIPTNFVLTTSHSTNSNNNGPWSASTSGASRYRLMTNEGKNGLAFLGQTAAQDARINWATSTRSGIQQSVLGATEPVQVRAVHRWRHLYGRRGAIDRPRVAAASRNAGGARRRLRRFEFAAHRRRRDRRGNGYDTHHRRGDPGQRADDAGRSD